MVALKDVLPIAGCREDAFESWLRRDLLTTAFEPGVRGRPRQLTRENALEIAFMARLTKVGLSAAKASALASTWVQSERALACVFLINMETMNSELFPESILNHSAAGLLTMGDLSDTTEGKIIPEGEPPFDPERDAPKPATGLNIIYIAEITRRIDELFLGRRA